MIEKPELQLLKISELKFDQDNPNYMTEEQMNVLRESFKRYGNLHPITVDQNNLIADGEHRAKVYEENGEQFIPGYKLTLDETERRMLRQIMNKNRGQHEPEKDYSELIALIANKQNMELLNLMGVNHGTLGELEEIITANKEASKSLEEIMQMNRQQDLDQTESEAKSYLYGNIKQITTYYDNKTFEQAIDMCQMLMKLWNLDNHTDLFWSLLNYAYNNRHHIQVKKLHLIPPKQEMKITYS
jgi:ParB/Sulfiredoxin domain